MTDDKLSRLVHKEAEKSGISAKDARKAYKKIRSGCLMSQIAQPLYGQFMNMNPNMTARDKLHMKLQQLRGGRSSKICKQVAYEKTREEAKKAEEDEAAAKIEKQRSEEEKTHRHLKKLKAIEKRIGIVSQELYNATLLSLRENKYEDDGLRNRDKNIIDLYAMQQEFSQGINMDDMEL